MQSGVSWKALGVKYLVLDKGYILYYIIRD